MVSTCVSKESSILLRFRIFCVHSLQQRKLSWSQGGKVSILYCRCLYLSNKVSSRIQKKKIGFIPGHVCQKLPTKQT